MPLLKPDKTETLNGVVIKTKFIPIGAKMNKPIGRHKKGDPFRDQRKLNAKGVTAHNTGAINQAKGTTMAEQYSRATYPNQNMNTVRPHYYVDDVEAWHIVPETDVSWCQGEAGNISDISVEIIGPKAEDNGARLIAMIMNRHGFPISQLRTHNYWMGLPNKIVSGASKNCPVYILPHWSTFVATVERYMAEFSGQPVPEPTPVSYKVKVNTANGLNVRQTPNGAFLKTLPNGTQVTITQEQPDSTRTWGYTATHKGWIALDFTVRVTPAPTPVPPNATIAWMNANRLKRGDRGKLVEAAQAALVLRGYDVAGIDGVFGPATDRAVRALQTAHKITVDGWIGRDTWSILLGNK